MSGRAASCSATCAYSRAGARIIARRAPGQPSVSWLVILDRGLDAADPAVRAAVEAALTDLRAVTGADEATPD
jgi:hypothetical protein